MKKNKSVTNSSTNQIHKLTLFFIHYLTNRHCIFSHNYSIIYSKASTLSSLINLFVFLIFTCSVSLVCCACWWVRSERFVNQAKKNVASFVRAVRKRDYKDLTAGLKKKEKKKEKYADLQCLRVRAGGALTLSNTHKPDSALTETSFVFITAIFKCEMWALSAALQHFYICSAQNWKGRMFCFCWVIVF